MKLAEGHARKCRSGGYRVWAGYSDSTRIEARYPTKTLAEDYITRVGGYLICEDFDTFKQAEAYLNEKRGEVWW